MRRSWENHHTACSDSIGKVIYSSRNFTGPLKMSIDPDFILGTKRVSLSPISVDSVRFMSNPADWVNPRPTSLTSDDGLARVAFGHAEQQGKDHPDRREEMSYDWGRIPKGKFWQKYGLEESLNPEDSAEPDYADYE